MNKEDDDLRRLRNSRGMLESFEQKIRSYLTTDISLSNSLHPAGVNSVLLGSPTGEDVRYSRSKSLFNPIRESRKLSEQESKLKRRLDQTRRRAEASPGSKKPSLRDIDAPKQIAVCNRRSDYRDPGHAGVKAGKGRYALVSNLIGKETVLYENRLDYYNQKIKSQEEEIALLYRELELAKEGSQYVDQYSLPPSLEHKYNMIKYRGKLPGKEKKKTKEENMLVEENSPVKSKKSQQKIINTNTKSENRPISSYSGSVAATANPVASLVGSGVFNFAGQNPSNRTIAKKEPKLGPKKSSSSRTKKSKGKQGESSWNQAIPGAHRTDLSKVDSDPFTKGSVQILNRAKSKETAEGSHKSAGRVDGAVLNPILNLINSFR